MVFIIMMVLCIASLGFSFQIESNGQRQAKGIDIGSNSYRAIIVKENMKFIDNHNRKVNQTYKLFPYSQFISLTNNQVKELYSIKPIKLETLSSFGSGIKVQAPKTQKKLKAIYVDLSTVFGTPVNDQGRCGNCYAVATTDAVNMVSKAAGKNHFNYSSQHLTDCSKGQFGNNGCSGGSFYGAFQYIKVRGVHQSAHYPININTTKFGWQQPCQTVAGARKHFIKNWYYFIGPGFTSRISYLLQGYTIAIGISAGNPYFQYYKSGVLTDCYGALTIDHLVVLVGAYYNPNDLKSSYFKIKNSWGLSWGESGYIRISLGEKACLTGYYGAFATF